MLDSKLLQILVCPKCKGSLKLEENYLLCYHCKLKYPIKDDIPIMLLEEATRLE